jgi:hypothetical protein
MELWPVKIIENSILWGRASSGTATTLKDDSKNMTADLFKDKLIKVIIGGIEYVRKITANTADTFTFGAIVSAVAAKAVIDHTAAGGGKVTITADPVGAYANEYKAITVQGDGASAETEADFVDGLLTITLGTDAGTAASAEIGTGAHGVITITCKEVGDVNYSVIVSLQEGENLPMSATLFADGTMYIALGTDEHGDPDATQNTAELIAAQINGATTTKDVFTAVASGDGSGVFSAAIPAVLFEGGVDPAVNATAANVKTAVEAIEGDPFTVVADTAGVIGVLESPITFSGGVDEVKPVNKTEYFVV